MRKILFDCRSVKHKNTGLYTFCTELGFALLRNLDEHSKLYFYVAAEDVGTFGKEANYVLWKWWHKYIRLHWRSFALLHQSSQEGSQKLRGMKKLITIHDLNFLVEKKDRPQKINSRLKSIQLQIDESDSIVCISDYVVNQVKENLRIKHKPLRRIYNGCSWKAWNGETIPSNIPQKPFLFSIGVVYPKKNFHVLPSLLPFNDFDLVIAGKCDRKSYVDRVLHEARQLGVENRVHLIGEIDDEERSWYYEHCRAFLFPSIAEGFGLPVIEAMHYGKPVFLNRASSLPEIGGKLAFYFSDFDGFRMNEVLLEGIANFEQGQMQEEAKRWAAQFNWDTTAQRYIKCYNELFDPPADT